MAYLDNRPSLDSLKLRLTGLDLTDFKDELLDELLEASAGWVEDAATTRFNGEQIEERYDGNGTNALTLRKRPATSARLVEVQTPILGYIRTYTAEEIKLYRQQGFLKIFTYKLAVEQAMLNTLDYQAWGTIFPPLPQAVRVKYTYGFPQYDPQANVTTLDGGATSEAGDTRVTRERNWLKTLQQAAIADAAASLLAQTAGLKVGVVQSVSFDGYSRQLNPAAFGPQVQALVEARDRALGRYGRRFVMTSTGG